MELIDTCWNVNIITAIITAMINNELIDTCWNVNISDDKQKEYSETN